MARVGGTIAAFTLILHVLYVTPWLTTRGFAEVAWVVAAALAVRIVASVPADVRSLCDCG